jgi:PIN domain nuclease of toxin-antitoxin system
LTEVATICHQRGYQHPPRQLLQDLEALGLRMQDHTADHVVRAAELIWHSRQEKHRHGGRSLALGDALCIALAEQLNCPVVTGDTLWNELEDEFTVEVHLFR